MRIAFVEWPEAQSTNDALWPKLKDSVTAARPDILVTNELPFGPWIADTLFFRRPRRSLASAHTKRGLKG